MSSRLRALLPREHGLNAWVGVPLLGAVLLAPRPAVLGCALAVLAGFAAFNALRRGERGLAVGALAIGAALAASALPALDRPAWGSAAMGCAGLGAAAAAGRWGRAMPRVAELEALCIVGLGSLATVLAIAGGAAPGRAIALAAVLASWQITGLWWVRRALCAVLPGRTPWRAGLPVALFAALGAGAASVALGELGLALSLLAQPLRLALDRPPRSAREAPRVGFTELGWALAVAVLGGAL